MGSSRHDFLTIGLTPVIKLGCRLFPGESGLEEKMAGTDDREWMLGATSD